MTEDCKCPLCGADHEKYAKVPLGALHELTGESPPPVLPLWDSKGKRSDLNLHLIGAEPVSFKVKGKTIVEVPTERWSSFCYSTTPPKFQIGSFVRWSDWNSEKEIATAIITNVELNSSGDWRYGIVYHKIHYTGQKNELHGSVAKMEEERGASHNIDEERLTPVALFTDIARLLMATEVYDMVDKVTQHARDDGDVESFKLSPEDVQVIIKKQKEEKW